jgi:SH3-like domain-containing protein
MKTISILFLLAFPASAAAPGAEMRSVAAEQVNVRSGPGGSYDVVWRAVKLYPLEVLDREGAWVRVSDYENEEGWVHGSLLAETPSVVVVSRKANVREGPGPDRAVVWEVDKEFPMKVLDTSGSWYHVTDDDGLEGWIHKSVTWGYSDNTEINAAGAD